MSDDSNIETKREAVEKMQGASGQGYFTAPFAFRVLAQFAEDVTEEYILDHTDDLTEDELHESVHEKNARWALSKVLDAKQRSGAEARSIAAVYPHQRIVTMEEVSEMVVEAIGEEPSDATMLGHGSTADVRHEENVETISDTLDITEDEEDGDD